MLPPKHILVAFSLAVCVGACGDSDGTGGREPDAPPPSFAGIAPERPTGAASIDSAGLVAAFDFETPTDDGAVRDLSPNGLHARPTIRNPTPGRFGEAQAFEIVQHRLALPADPRFDVDGPLTIAAWVRVDRPGLHQHIVACDDKWALWVTPDDRYRLGDTRGGGWSTASGSVVPGVWTPVVAVLSGTAGDPLTRETVALWVNGERAAVAEAHLRTEEARELGTWNPGELYPSDACYIGFESHQGNEAHRSMPFVGAVDELLIFSRAWTDEEVRTFSTPSTPEPLP
ncbi:MAG: LamG domain-containing protein [Gemmatimonadota bacterium]|nr:LamG domain-containing protein [Gemmatimonadota bacterium]